MDKINRSKKIKRVLACICALMLAFCLFPKIEIKTASAAGVVGLNKYLYDTSNLIPYPYENSGPTGSNTGLVYNQNDDYSITFNGTTTKLADYVFFQGNIDYSTFVYKLSLSLDVLRGSWTGSTEPYLQVYLNGQYTGSATPSKGWKNENISVNGRTMTRVILYFPSGTTLTNFTVRPMLNSGTVAYPYSPYYLLPFNDGFSQGENFNLYNIFSGATFDVRISDPTQNLVLTYNDLIPNYYTTPAIGFEDFYNQYITSNMNSDDCVLQIDVNFTKVFDYNNSQAIAVSSSYQFPLGEHTEDWAFMTLFTKGANTQTIQADYNQTSNFSVPYVYKGYFGDTKDTYSLRFTINNPYIYFKDFLLTRLNIDDTVIYDKGYQNGYSQGLADGEGTGYNNGFNAGQNEGYTEGYNNGYQEGQDVGYSQGYDEGEQNGYNEGRADGYDKGLEDSGGFFNLFYSAVNAPVSVLTDMFNFEILGVNMTGFIMSIISLAILVCVVRLFI